MRWTRPTRTKPTCALLGLWRTVNKIRDSNVYQRFSLILILLDIRWGLVSFFHLQVKAVTIVLLLYLNWFYRGMIAGPILYKDDNVDTYLLSLLAR